jgi:hypothetical protein
MNHWSDKAVWAKECQGYEGFAEKSDNVCISHEKYCQIIASINKRFMLRLNVCMDKTEKMYIKTRCALIILNRMSPVFPNSLEIAESI